MDDVVGVLGFLYFVGVVYVWGWSDWFWWFFCGL